MREPVIQLGDWASSHLAEIKRAREAFDSRDAE